LALHRILAEMLLFAATTGEAIVYSRTQIKNS